MRKEEASGNNEALTTQEVLKRSIDTLLRQRLRTSTRRLQARGLEPTITIHFTTDLFAHQIPSNVVDFVNSQYSGRTVAIEKIEIELDGVNIKVADLSNSTGMTEEEGHPIIIPANEIALSNIIWLPTEPSLRYDILRYSTLELIRSKNVWPEGLEGKELAEQGLPLITSIASLVPDPYVRKYQVLPPKYDTESGTKTKEYRQYIPKKFLYKLPPPRKEIAIREII